MAKFNKDEFKIELLPKDLLDIVHSFKTELNTYNPEIEKRLRIMVEIIQSDSFQNNLNEGNYKFWIDLVNSWGEFELMIPFFDNIDSIKLPKYYTRYCLYPEWYKLKPKYYLDEKEFQIKFPDYNKSQRILFEQILNRTLYTWFILIWHKLKLYSIGYSANIIQNSIARMCDINRVCNFEDLPSDIQNMREDGYEHEYQFEMNEEIIMNRLSNMYI